MQECDYTTKKSNVGREYGLITLSTGWVHVKSVSTLKDGEVEKVASY